MNSYSLNIFFNLKKNHKIVGLFRVMMCLFSLLMLEAPQNVSQCDFNHRGADRNGQWGLTENLLNPDILMLLFVLCSYGCKSTHDL